MDKLIDGVAARYREAAGGRRPRHHVRQRERPSLPLRGDAGRRSPAMTAVVTALKPALKVPFGVNYLWDPSATVAIACATGAAFVARDLHRPLRLRHGPLAAQRGGRADAPPQSRPAGPEAALQHQCRVRRIRSTRGRSSFARKSAVFSSLADAILVSGPLTGQAVDTSDLKRVREAVPGRAALRQYRRATSTMSATSSRSPTAASSAPISRSTATPGIRSTATA